MGVRTVGLWAESLLEPDPVCGTLAEAQCCMAAFILLLVSDWWTVSLLYAGWLWLDWDTPSSGGRRSQWVRSWTVWEHFRDYFPLKLIKTVDLDPAKNYIFGFHPHGVLVAGGFGNFCTEATGFSRLFPGLRPHLLMLPFWFRVPFFRDYIMCGGLVSSSKASLSHLISQPEGGNVAVIAVGGASEALDARPGSLTLQVQSMCECDTPAGKRTLAYEAVLPPEPFTLGLGITGYLT
ncbi:2-acylglycerol O-acyltransferase 2, partial [Oryzias melastigma]|uniref:2-acylglycerol O-acyltransferase 2 n=1 Tax=Oryzias melastigma TaxID=30732 RepID=UPI000CF812FD